MTDHTWGKLISPNRIALQVGDEVDSKYRIEKQLGEGGMGMVYAATNLRLQQKVAIKVLRNDLVCSNQLRRRFEREARACSQLRGPNVARVLDVDNLTDGSPFIVMEYLEGHDLGRLIQHRGKLPVRKAVDLVLQACTAIAEAHAQGIVHRDLKPENLFLQKANGGHVLKVLDFGISKMATDGTGLTKTNVMLGSPLYMAPEQIRSSRSADTRADVWSLGVILFELVAGRTPFHERNTAKLFSAIMKEPLPTLVSLGVEAPPELDAILSRALARRVADRYRTVHQLAMDLLPFASNPGFWRADAGEPAEPSAEQDRILAEMLETDDVDASNIQLYNDTVADGPARARSNGSAPPVSARQTLLMRLKPRHYAALVLGAVVVCLELFVGAQLFGSHVPAASAQSASDIKP